MQAAALASQRASRTASLIASRAALTPHASAEQVLDGMRKLSDIAPAVDTIETTEESTAASRLAFYLTFSSYTVTSSIVVSPAWCSPRSTSPTCGGDSSLRP